MAGTLKSIHGEKKIDGISNHKVGIVVSTWNEEITEMLYQGAYKTLIALGIQKEKIIRKNVPGCYELALGAQKMADQKNIDAIVCLGCVIRGETPHFDYICTAAAQGILRVSLDSGKPISFGVITAQNRDQALQRAGGTRGNKGEEATLAAIKML